MEIIQVLIDYQTDEQIAARLFLFLCRQAVERLRQNFVSGAIADFMNDVLLYFGEGPGIANGSATLRSHAGQLYFAAKGKGDTALLKDIAVQIYLSGLLIEIAAGQTAQHWQRRVGFIPGPQPAFA